MFCRFLKTERRRNEQPKATACNKNSKKSPKATACNKNSKKSPKAKACNEKSMENPQLPDGKHEGNIQNSDKKESKNIASGKLQSA